MPFTPLHLSLPLMTYAITTATKQNNKINKTTWASITLGSIIPDGQAFLSLFLPQIHMHGFSHTLIGAITYSIAYYLLLITIISKTKNKQKPFNPEKQATLFLISIIFYHLIPDVFIYTDMHIFWPINNKTYGNPQNYYTISLILIIIAIISTIILIITKIIEKTRPPSTNL